MTIQKQYSADVDAILSRRHDNGGDFWARSDGGVYYGSPFSATESVSMLSDLGIDPGNPLVVGATTCILNCWREDGRFRTVPGGATYPCHTIAATRALCRLGLARDKRLERTFEYLLKTVHTDGGWRCNKFMFGRGPETELPTSAPDSAGESARRQDRSREYPQAPGGPFLLQERALQRSCHHAISPNTEEPK